METDAKNRTPAHGRTESVDPNTRCWRTVQKGASEASQQRSFLTTEFEDLPVFDVEQVFHDSIGIEDGEFLKLGKARIAIQPNLIKLRKAGEAYCKVHNGILPPHSDNPLKELRMLVNAVIGCCPGGNYIEVDFNDKENELVLVELAETLYPDYTLFFVPLKFLETLQGPYRDFFVRFLRLMGVTMGITFPEDHFDFSYAAGYFDEEYLTDEENDNPGYAEIAESYRNGNAKMLFDEILKADWHILDESYCHGLFDFQRLIDESPYDELKEMLRIAEEGIDLMRGEYLEKYRYNLGHCSLEEFSTIDGNEEVCTMDRIFAFCYDDCERDEVTSHAVDLMNNDICNCVAEELYDTKIITQDYSSPFHSSDFPKKWMEWYMKFDQSRIEYEQAYKNDD